MAAELDASLLTRRIHLVTGKGGVGRTSVAAALALAAARTGKRVLLTEVGDPDGGYSAIARKFGGEHLTPDPVPLGPPGLDGCHIFATRGQELFARSVIPAGPLIRAALNSSALRKFVTAVPSLYELGLFFHLLTLIKAQNPDGSPLHEVIVADMPATGHTLALTRLPETLLAALPDGPIPRYMREGQSYLNDPACTVAWIVTLPERLPITEALELTQGLRDSKIEPAGVILNRVPHDPFDREERSALAALLARQPMHGELAFRRIGTAREAGEALRDATDIPIVEVPEEAPTSARPLHEQIADRLAHALGFA